MRYRFVLLGLSVVAVLSCKSTTATTPPTPLPCTDSGAAATVNATDGFEFTPATVTITVGQTVCWQNTGDQTHTVTDVATNGVRFNGNLPSGQAFIHTFGFGGRFEYRCKNHSTMTGVIVVKCRPGELTC